MLLAALEHPYSITSAKVDCGSKIALKMYHIVLAVACYVLQGADNEKGGYVSYPKNTDGSEIHRRKR